MAPYAEPKPMEWYYSPPLKLGVETDSGAACEQTLEVTVPLAVERKLRLDLRMSENELEPIFSGAAWAGTVFWRAAIQLCEQQLLRSPHCWRGKHVIELGCGIGVPGMIAALLGARVVLTEQPTLVDLLERNIAANFAADDGLLPPSAAVLSWEHQSEAAKVLPPGRAAFDVILCADCVFEPLYGTSWKPLSATIDALSDARTVVLLAVERRPSAAAPDGVGLFLDALAGYGFDAALVGGDHPVRLYRIQRRA